VPRHLRPHLFRHAVRLNTRPPIHQTSGRRLLTDSQLRPYVRRAHMFTPFAKLRVPGMMKRSVGVLEPQPAKSGYMCRRARIGLLISSRQTQGAASLQAPQVARQGTDPSRAPVGGCILSWGHPVTRRVTARKSDRSGGCDIDD